MAKRKSTKTVEALTHDGASRKNIPTAEYQAVMEDDDRNPVQVAYERRNRDLDPQLFWRGKDEQDWSDLVVQAPPLFIQEKVHPKVLIDELLRRSRETEAEKATDKSGFQTDLFADFNGLPSGEAQTEFYQHDANWSNRMILGDSLQVMASLAVREGLRGKVQCIYIDPPYGIKFNSNFQWSTTSRNVSDGKTGHITREPEQVKAFRDTWRDGIHSYLTYLRDRLTVARDLLTKNGSLFVQIGDENVHRVRAVMDEVFGAHNHICTIDVQKTGSVTGEFIQSNVDYVVWFGKSKEAAKFRPIFKERGKNPANDALDLSTVDRTDYSAYPMTSDGARDTTTVYFDFQGQSFFPGVNRHWGVVKAGLARVGRAGRIVVQKKQIRMRYFWDDYPVIRLGSIWSDVGGATGKVYVVQTAPRVIERLILMTSDPGDLVLDPTCGSGTTAYVAEQWGRRWITIDTSRVALALARARVMGARYPYYLLADSRDGQIKEAALARKSPSEARTHNNIRQGFVYERVPHITLKSIANNAEIDVIYENWQTMLEPLRADLNALLGQTWEEWEIPRNTSDDWSADAKTLHARWWEARIARQREIDASIVEKADYEYLYDKPYRDNRKVRVAGPFTIESLSPHRLLGLDENDELIDNIAEGRLGYEPKQDFAGMILDHLKTAGVQQAHKEDKISFSSITPWPGELVCAEGRFEQASGDGFDGMVRVADQAAGEPVTTVEKRAAIFVGPEFGTVSRPDLVQVAREAADAGIDILVACAFNYEAHSTDFDKLGRVPVLKARMNADLHMAGDLRNTGKGNLFVVFGEPDIDILDADGGQIKVKVNGVDVFHPNTGEIRSDSADGIACWFIDTDYNEESFFVRHAYFLGANNPYKALKSTLKAEINREAWETLNSDTSRPFDKPPSGRIAVKVINHLGDEVMKVFRI